MKKIEFAAAVLLLMLSLVVAPAAAGEPPQLVGLALPEAGTDKGWNEQGKVGLELVAKKYGFKIELAEALGYGDIKPTLRDMVKKGCALIICHASGYQTVAPEIARETGVKVTTVENHRAVTPGLISDIDTQPQGGQLPGGLAGRKNDPLKYCRNCGIGRAPHLEQNVSGFRPGSQSFESEQQAPV